LNRARFRIVILAVFAAICAYLIWSLGLSAAGATVLVLALATILWLPIIFWQQESESVTSVEVLMQWLAYGSMGFLSFLWITTMVRDLASLFVHFPIRSERGTHWVFAIATMSFTVGMLNAFFGLRIRKSEITFEKLPAALDGFRIVQISDVHTGPMIRERALKRIAKKVKSARPDLIVFTGDAVDGGVADLGPHMRPLAELEARFGKFYVPGNHEYYWGVTPWLDWFATAGYRVLLNRHEIVNVGGSKLLIAGVADPAAGMMKAELPNLSRALEGAPPDAYPRVLLAHQPGIAREAEKQGIHLQISGHTHGGQFFPWTLLVGLVHEFPQGLMKLAGMWIYVSRGTGYWGPPVRLGATSEVSLLILRAPR
jgi:hypothetical protein